MQFRIIINHGNPWHRYLLYEQYMKDGSLRFTYMDVSPRLSQLFKWHPDVELVEMYESFNGRMADIIHRSTLTDEASWIMEILRND